MMNRALFRGLLGLAVSVFPVAAQATPILYTNYGLWASNVSGSIALEDFESEPSGSSVVQLPYTTADGITLNWVSPQFGALQMLQTGLVNGSVGPHFRDFGDQLSVSFPLPVTAFGFEWDSAIESWDLHVGSSVFTLAANSAGFAGIIDTNPITSFVLTSSSYVQGGLSIDNLSYAAVPEPSTLLLLGSGLYGLRVLRRKTNA